MIYVDKIQSSVNPKRNQWIIYVHELYVTKAVHTNKKCNFFMHSFNAVKKFMCLNVCVKALQVNYFFCNYGNLCYDAHEHANFELSYVCLHFDCSGISVKRLSHQQTANCNSTDTSSINHWSRSISPHSTFLCFPASAAFLFSAKQYNTVTSHNKNV